MALLKRTALPALLASVAGHCLIAASLIAWHQSSRAMALDSTPVEVELLPQPVEPARAAPTDESDERAAPLAVRLPNRGALPNEPPASPAPSEAVPSDLPAPADSGSWSFSPRSQPELGRVPYHISTAYNVGAPSAAPAGSQDVETPAHTLDRIMRQELDAHDRDIGLGSGGALLAAAHEAASPSLAPDVGSATLEIDSDPTGKVVSARVVSASGDLPGWNDVARELIRVMASKPLRGRRDDGNRRTRLRIVAERVLPSGGAYARDPGAVSSEDCTGSGIGRKCAAGAPAGAGQSFDLSDLGAKPSRVVHVQFLSETSR